MDLRKVFHGAPLVGLECELFNMDVDALANRAIVERKEV